MDVHVNINPPDSPRGVSSTFPLRKRELNFRESIRLFDYPRGEFANKAVLGLLYVHLGNVEPTKLYIRCVKFETDSV